MARGYSRGGYRGGARRSSGGRSSARRSSSSRSGARPKGQIKSGKAVQYAIKSRRGATKYIGTTNNPSRRASEHKKTGKLGRGDKLVVQTRAISRKSAERVEAARLGSHRRQHGRNPRHNTTTDGKFHSPDCSRLGPPNGRDLMQPIALYVHIPFCETKCPYCDFNTYAKIESLIPDYVAALRTEIELWGGLLDGPPVRTIFFGGGTPSYLPSGDISALMATISGSFTLQDDAEITLEANPGDFTSDKLNDFLDAGINRLSIGVQSFDDGLLTLLGRRHTASDAVDAYRMAHGARFDNVSIDLMYGLPHQTIDHWQKTLARTAELHPPHVSLYALTLEGGTPMEHSVTQGTLPTPDPDLAADMYALAEHDLGALGYRHYEISNWASDGKLGLHNIVYWRNEPYLGVGPGAHSSLASHRFSNLKPPREYVRRLRGHSGSSGSLNGSREDDYAAIRSMPVVDTIEFIDRRLEMAETMMLGLRLDTGVSVSDFEARFGVSPIEVYRKELAELQPTGLVETVDGSIRLTDRGRFLSNEVFVRFFD